MRQMSVKGKKQIIISAIAILLIIAIVTSCILIFYKKPSDSQDGNVTSMVQTIDRKETLKDVSQYFSISICSAQPFSSLRGNVS